MRAAPTTLGWALFIGPLERKAEAGVELIGRGPASGMELTVVHLEHDRGDGLVAEAEGVHLDALGSVGREARGHIGLSCEPLETDERGQGLPRPAHDEWQEVVRALAIGPPDPATDRLTQVCAEGSRVADEPLGEEPPYLEPSILELRVDIIQEEVG